jgi:crotonobetainyl-CoA:carnitine CoA-transferase CaiB-like acyl-CoA transferase
MPDSSQIDSSQPDSSQKILAGIKVVDLSRVLAGPYCGQLLADFGATVIKVESPEGDENRRWPPLSSEGVSANFGSVNRGKRAMVLNLKTEAARGVACAPTHSLDQIVTHPQVLANAMRLQASNPDGSMPDLVGTPFKLADGGGTADTAAPTLGADTDAILADTLDLSRAEIAGLRVEGAFTIT